MQIETDLLYIIVGKIVVLLVFLLFITAILGLALVVYFFKTNRSIFPRFALFSIALFESVMKALLRLAKMDDCIVDEMGIALRNRISHRKFKDTPKNKRLIFLPQCLRSINCPAKLGPDGIACVNCGQCEIGRAKKTAENLGYKVHIVPGSSFIRRIVQKHKDCAIFGVGCAAEVKAGLEMCEKLNLCGVGLALEKAGCVSTILDWDKFYDLIETE